MSFSFRSVTNSATVFLAVVSGGSASIWLGCCPKATGFKVAEASLVFLNGVQALYSRNLILPIILPFFFFFFGVCVTLTKVLSEYLLLLLAVQHIDHLTLWYFQCPKSLR